MAVDPRALFRPDLAGLMAGMQAVHAALAAPGEPAGKASALALPLELPQAGSAPETVLERLAESALGQAARLDHPGFFAHMDPPTPWPTWVTAAWAAAVNQNLLHPDTAPQARQLESRVVAWLTAPLEMPVGHLVSGSSAANLTALWAARQRTGARRVLASTAAHLSVRKAADILGLEYETVPADADQRLPAHLPDDLSDTIVVLTAGTTITGSIDPLTAGSGAAWRHVDAAWAGPLVFSPRHRHLLDGVRSADSVAVSCHKWLFQPKESALIAFREPASQEAVTYDGPYLAAPNVGLAGSHGAAAGLALAATLLTLGSAGLATLIEGCLATARHLADLVAADPALELWRAPVSGIVVWRPRRRSEWVRPSDVWVSTATLEGERWFRSVAANPMADPVAIHHRISSALGS